MSERRADSGQALILAMIIMFLAAIIIAGVTVAVRSGSERGADSRDRNTAFGTAQEAAKAYRAALASGKAGEGTRFVLTAATLQSLTVPDGGGAAVRCTATETRLCWQPNTETAYDTVDDTNIGGPDQITIRKEIQGATGSGAYAFWQVLSVVPPRFGISCPGACVAPGGRVVAYFRAWVGAVGTEAKTKPIVTRAEFRAAQFSDYEVVADGKISLGAGANVNGAVHSNGFPSSYQDQYAGQPAQINFAAGVNCSSWARISVSSNPGGGWYSAPGACAALRTDRGVPTVNLLRANSTIANARTRCGAGPPLPIVCFNRANGDPTAYTVILNGNGLITVDGVNYNAINSSTGWGPGGQYGMVLIFNRSVHVSGTLGAGGRATIMTGATTTGKIDEPASVYFDQPWSVGSDPSDGTTSVGFISANDVIAIESTACPLTVNAAMVASGGMLSMDPRFRGQIAFGDSPCNSFHMHGSISGHHSPYMTTGASAGYTGRQYDYDAQLFHNPPPLFPTVRNWDIQSTKLANLDCFDASTHVANREGCS